MRIVFFGTPEFAVKPLEVLAEEHEVTLVVTNPDRQRGRGKKLLPTPVKEKAIDLSIPVITPESVNNPEMVNLLKREKADAFVVVAYGSILKPAVLDLPSYKCINIHGSILPKYRGAAPIERSILEGESEAGVSIMEMEEGLDSGPVAKILTLPIGGLSASEVRRKLSVLGAKGISEVLKNPKNYVWKEQDHSLATYAPKIQKGEGELILGKDTTFMTKRKVQGMDTFGGAYLNVNGIKIKVFKVRDSHYTLEPGKIEEKDGIYLGCSDGTLEVMELQVPNKKRMDVNSFLLGNSLKDFGLGVG